MSAVPLIQRRRAELQRKVQSLDTELNDWKARTQEPGFRRHHRQVERLAATLEGLIEPVRTRFKNPIPEDDLLAKSAAWETEILAAHTIWEVFRSKLVLRQSSLFRDSLAACDDFAFECYKPARDKFTKNPKEPPLVYLSATWSPFAVSRDSNFQNEIRAARGTAGYLAQPEFQQVMNKLPIPLLSIPWSQASLLPCGLILAHEVGHIVEWDFDLTDSIAQSLERAGLEHTPVWLEWAREVFADIYGCLAAGPAFVGALMDLLAASCEAIQQEERESGKYPTSYLRIELCLTALKALGRQADAQRLRNDWAATYGPMTKMTAYLPDTVKVVQHLIAGPYHGYRLDAVISPPSSNLANVAQAGLYGTGLDPINARLIFAGARWLLENHANTEQVQKACLELRKRLVTSTADEFRAKDQDRGQLDEEETLFEAQKEMDRALGLSLRTELGF